MHKKIVVLGGGTGISYFLRGMKDFPVDITAVITVSDNGRSTGKLRKEFNIPAVGDIRKVISNLSNIDPEIKELMEYKFKTSSDLNGHKIGNLILTAMFNMTGSLTKSIDSLSKLLNVRHQVLPLSEDTLTLMGETIEGEIIEGETALTTARKKYKKIYYKETPHVLKEVLKAIKEANLIVFSMGSLYTSILPHLICEDIIKAIDHSKAKIMYLCNAMTQPGETDDFGVSDHIKILNQYLDKRHIDVVVASNTTIKEKIKRKYETEEQKDPVYIDKDDLEKLGVELIEDDLLIVEDNTLRHESIKLASHVFSYLMRC